MSHSFFYGFLCNFERQIGYPARIVVLIAFYNATAIIIVHKTDSVTGADVSGATYDLFVSDSSGGYIEAINAWGNNINPLY